MTFLEDVVVLKRAVGKKNKDFYCGDVLGDVCGVVCGVGDGSWNWMKDCSMELSLAARNTASFRV